MEDDTTTLPYAIQQGSWYRSARNCAGVPLLGMAGSSLLWAVTRNEGFAALGIFSVLAAIPLFFASLLCFLRFVFMARRDPEGGPVTFLKRFVLVLVLLFLNLSVLVVMMLLW